METYQILVVDDQAVIRKMIRRFLEADPEHHFEIVEAENGKIALDKLKEHSFDMILTDLEMPEMNGLELITVVRERSHFDNLPILFLTSVTDTETKVKAFERSATDYVVKPFTEDELRARILAHLERQRMMESVRIQALKTTRIAHFYRNLQSLELDKLEESVLVSFKWLFQIRQIDFYLIQDFTKQIYLKTSTEPIFSSTPSSAKKSLIEKGLQQKMPVIFDTELLVEIENTRDVLDSVGILLPLFRESHKIGAIGLQRLPKNFFKLYDSNDLESLQYYVSNVWYNAKLFHDLKTTKIQLAETEKIARMTETFEKFVPRQFLQRIATQGIEEIKLGHAHSDSITIMFTDIRSFTSFSEEMMPQELLNFLNNYFKQMNRIIHQYHGFVDKFIGDAIMALFEDSKEEKTLPPYDAVLAAIEMQVSLEKYNLEWKRLKLPEINVGIGIHTGPVIIGTVGSEDRMDSTVLGDSVNLASRLEGLTKMYRAKIIISDATYQQIKHKEELWFRELDQVSVKGKEKSVRIYEVINSDHDRIRDKKRSGLKLFHESLKAFRSRNFEEARLGFERFLRLVPQDVVAEIYLNRCDEFIQNPPPRDWNGVARINHK